MYFSKVSCLAIVVRRQKNVTLCESPPRWGNIFLDFFFFFLPQRDLQLLLKRTCVCVFQLVQLDIDLVPNVPATSEAE